MKWAIASWAARALDVAGHAKTHRGGVKGQRVPHLYQPSARKDRRGIRQPGDHHGGRALKFYSSVRIEVRRIGAIKDGDQIMGNRTKIKVVKNKVAAPFREVEVDILYGQGISREGDLLDLGATHEVVRNRGCKS